jgi:uncharacterized repeat protein (TIGR03803 family)
MLEGADGYLYGTTITEGTGYNGSVFKVARDGSTFQPLYGFYSTSYGDGGWAQGRLVQGSDGYLYGTTKEGGNPSSGIYSYLGNGTLYKINTNGGGYEVIYGFPTTPTTGDAPIGGLRFGSDGYLYGVASGGGSAGGGTIFKFDTNTLAFTVIYNLDPATGTFPEGALIEGTDGALYGTANEGGIGTGTAFRATTDGNTFSVLHDFVPGNGGDASAPEASVSIYGNAVYGTASDGGANNAGAVFALKVDGTGYALLHSFTNGTGDGNGPETLVIKGADGALYGANYSGGASNLGTVFRLATDASSYSLLHQFTGPPQDGSGPSAGLIEGTNGALYGTTLNGGSNSSGTVYRLAPDASSYQVLYSFSNTPDGSYPQGQLLQASDGKLYGTTSGGGTNGDGTVFSMDLDGSGYRIVHSFAGSTNDGQGPQAGLLQGADGMLYGTTEYGGSNYSGTIFQMNTTGSVVNILHSFNGSTDGGDPQCPLAQGSNGALYGVCMADGTNYDGTVFTIATNGTGFAVLHTFSSDEGNTPYGGLAVAGDGSLWGTLIEGGTQGFGAIYKIFGGGERLAAGPYSASGFSFNFSGGRPSQAYQILVSTNLKDWSLLAAPTSDANGAFEYQDPAATNDASRFYKTSGP